MLTLEIAEQEMPMKYKMWRKSLVFKTVLISIKGKGERTCLERKTIRSWCRSDVLANSRLISEQNYLLENTKLDTSAILNHWLGRSGNNNILTAKVKVEPEAVSIWKITVNYIPCIWAVFYLIKVNPCGTMVTTAIQSLHNSIFLLRPLVSFFWERKIEVV